MLALLNQVFTISYIRPSDNEKFCNKAKLRRKWETVYRREDIKQHLREFKRHAKSLSHCNSWWIRGHAINSPWRKCSTINVVYYRPVENPTVSHSIAMSSWTFSASYSAYKKRHFRATGMLRRNESCTIVSLGWQTEFNECLTLLVTDWKIRNNNVSRFM